MNDSRAYMIGKQLIEAGKSLKPEVINDPTTDLKALLKAQGSSGARTGA